ncbi:MAG TPA: tetratricopeptide repeat protein [Chitinophagaceae bacterium]|nr:tetratricopeptide repeat protein [Chitinophagaceae bacterium]
MKKYSHLIYLFNIVLLTVSGFLYAEAQQADSLSESILTSENDKLQTYNSLGRDLVTTDFNKSKIYSFKGIRIAEKQKNTVMLANLYRTLGACYTVEGKYDSASYSLNKALSFAIKTKNEALIAYINLSVATLNIRKNNFQEALKQFFELLPVFEKSNDKPNIRKTLGSIAASYMYLENFNQAEKYYNEAIQVASEIKDSSGLGQAYQGLCRIASERQETDKALSYALQSAEAFHACGEKIFESVAKKEAALIYLKKNDAVKAEEMAGQSLALAKAIGGTRYIANALSTLSSIALHKKEYSSAIQYANEALKTDSVDSDTKTTMLEHLVIASISLGKAEDATHYFNEYRKVIDYRINKNYQKSLSEMEVKYGTEKQQLKIDSLEKTKRLTLFTSIAGALVSLLIILLLISRQHNISHKKLLAEQKVAQLEQEKKLIATQAVLDGETAERARLARDLHDGLGGMLSVIKLNLHDVKKGINLEGEDVSRFNQALDMLETSTKELRRVAHNMMPESLSRYGLKASLQDFLSNIPDARLHHFGEDSRIDSKLEIILYRIAYELVNNALRHADAKNINVQIVQHPDLISLTVQDDGKGFDPESVTDGHGLQNAKSRIASLNGNMNVLSAAGQGTEIIVEFKTANQS